MRALPSLLTRKGTSVDVALNATSRRNNPSSVFFPQGRLQGGVGPPPPLGAPSGCRVGLPRPPGQAVLPAAGVRPEPTRGYARPPRPYPCADAGAHANSTNTGRTRHAGAALTDDDNNLRVRHKIILLFIFSQHCKKIHLEKVKGTVLSDELHKVKNVFLKLCMEQNNVPF